MVCCTDAGVVPVQPTKSSWSTSSVSDVSRARAASTLGSVDVDGVGDAPDPVGGGPEGVGGTADGPDGVAVAVASGEDPVPALAVGPPEPRSLRWPDSAWATRSCRRTRARVPAGPGGHAREAGSASPPSSAPSQVERSPVGRFILLGGPGPRDVLGHASRLDRARDGPRRAPQPSLVRPRRAAPPARPGRRQTRCPLRDRASASRIVSARPPVLRTSGRVP